MLDRLFNTENRFWTFANKLADVIILELLWLITSLPLITIGAASSAFWHVLLRIAEDQEGHILSDYFHAFRTNLKTGTAAWLLQLAAGLFLGADIYACFQIEHQMVLFLLGVFGVLLLLYVFISLYIYPLIGRFDFSLKKVIGNSVFLAMRHLPHTVCMVILPAAALVASYFFSYLIIFLPALAFYLDARLFLWIFSQYMEDDETEE